MLWRQNAQRFQDRMGGRDKPCTLLALLRKSTQMWSLADSRGSLPRILFLGGGMVFCIRWQLRRDGRIGSRLDRDNSDTCALY